ncbi:sensor histidine kinase [Sporosalibacterium faouarense]|uniref:sensor histidine kinase n=1 Tax=Sporosalibacterium faouarense TaxID=516123 RepID=UPI00141CBA6D|nr:histidine kinase [Sporosalibacterium faouarense]MTI47135.1 HAMP domain-containing protein [Bacillota bacterium]
MKRELFHFRGIRKKLILFYLIITLILTITSLFSYYNAKSVLKRQKSIIEDYVFLNSFNNDITNLEIEVEKYLTTKSSESLINYYNIYNEINTKVSNIPREVVNDKKSLMLKDIGYMIENLLKETDNAIQAKRGRISSQYTEHFKRANEIAGYIKFYINSVINDKLQNLSIEYSVINNKVNYISVLNIIIIVSSVIINTFIAVIFTYKLTRPIIKLSSSAEKIANGNFDIKPVIINTDDEINILAKAFNKMTVNIKNHIEEIKGQVMMEKLLKEKEMQNIKMKSLLKDTELKMLQSQINPHFLFNTLNAAAQLSIIEGAEHASEFIEKVAELFRYNLKKLDQPVTLEDEVRNVKTYMYILGTRFGEKIKYSYEADKSVLDTVIPCTILQPIVENAYIHGLEDLERNGRIDIKVERIDDKVKIEISDNGKGMTKENIDSILSPESLFNISKNHVTGIGMHNVIDRLRLFYNIEDINKIIEIESKLNIGTKVTLKLPYIKEVIQ